MRLAAVKVLEVKQTQQISDTFKIRQVWVETSDQYPQILSIEFTQDKCELLDGCSKGDVLDIEINLRGRKWTNKEGKELILTTVRGWRIDKISQQQKIEYPEPIEEKPRDVDSIPEGDDDDLPF